MEIEKQRLILSALASNRDLMALCASILKPSYFDTSLKKTAKFMISYFEKYHDIPKFETIKAENGIELDNLGNITKADMSYVSQEIEQFCQNRAATEAILSGAELVQKGDYSKIISLMKDAIAVGLHKDMGLDYFSNPEERLRQTLISQSKISTGIDELDDALGGGIGRQELILFAANSGGGKSMTMLNLAKNLLTQGLNGVYISLEMAEGIVSKRLDSMITSIPQDSLLKDMKEVATRLEKASTKMGKFIIKRMPENRTNANTIRSYLQQLEQSTGFTPDFIVVDYIDIMGTSMSISYDNLFVKDKYVTEEVRSLGFDFNAVVISASQLGRCLSQSTLISLQNGEQVTLQDIKVGDVLKGRTEPVTVVAKTEAQRKKVFKIKLKNGQSILATAEHRFPTRDGIASISSGLAAGDFLIIDGSNNI
jgi:archaellum biogenesis ATPase FlaH